MSSRPRDSFPKELIDSAVAHSKDSKKRVVPKKKIPAQVEASQPKLESSRAIEMSQTTPKISAGFEEVFSKVIGSGAPLVSMSSDYSVTYQRAFGTAVDKKRASSKEEKKSEDRPDEETRSVPKADPTGRGHKEGLSATYTTVFSRLAKSEDTEDAKVEIRESLKNSLENAEETKITPEAATSTKSVFEMLSHNDSAPKGQGPRTPKEEEIAKMSSDKLGRSEKSVFERLSSSKSE